MNIADAGNHANTTTHKLVNYPNMRKSIITTQANHPDAKVLEILIELLDGWMNTPAGDQSPFFDRPEFFDKLAGGPTLRTAIEDASRSGRIDSLWQEERQAFLERRSRYLRYPAED